MGEWVSDWMSGWVICFICFMIICTYYVQVHGSLVVKLNGIAKNRKLSVTNHS